jgi:thioredoxin-related protein
VVHGLEVEYYDRINFVYLDIDDSRTDEFKRVLGYRVQPHIFLLDGDGNIIQQWLGLVSESDFRAAFDGLS